MKIIFVNDKKTYAVYYRLLNENERSNATGLRTAFMDQVKKHSPDTEAAKEAINKNKDLNVEVYKIEEA